MGRISRGVSMLSLSARVLGRSPRLLLLPLCALVSIAAVVAATVLAEVGIAHDGRVSTGLGVLAYALMFVAAVICVFIGTLFDAAVIAGASRALEGQPVSIGTAFNAAWSRRGALFGWALVSGSVGLMARSVGSRGRVGQAVGTFTSVAWGLATYLAVPVIMFEGSGPLRAVPRSTNLYQNRWGEEMTGSFGISLVLMLVSTPFFILGSLLLLASVTAGLVVLAALAAALVVASVGLIGTFTAALYRDASTGAVMGSSGGFGGGGGGGDAHGPVGPPSFSAPLAHVSFDTTFGQAPCFACGAPGIPGAFCPQCGSPRRHPVGVGAIADMGQIVPISPWQPPHN